MKTYRVNILGAPWTVKVMKRNEDKTGNLKDCNGYTDDTTQTCVIADEPGDLGEPVVYLKKVIRHEIIHAFLSESGLRENWEHKEYGHEETTVDWFAVMFPKMIEVFRKCDAL